MLLLLLLLLLCCDGGGGGGVIAVMVVVLLLLCCCRDGGGGGGGGVKSVKQSRLFRHEMIVQQSSSIEQKTIKFKFQGAERCSTCRCRVFLFCPTM